MANILIITSTVDYTVDYIIDRYSSNEIKFYRLNIDLLNFYRIDIENNNIKIECENWTINFNKLSSIYYRKPMLPNLQDYEEKYKVMIGKDIISVINGLVDSFDKRVLSKPCILRKVENKIYQFIKAEEVGFKLPKSLISNNTVYAKKFINSETIIKPLTTGKIISNDGIEIFQTNYINKLDENIDITPVYMQEYINKLYEVRVTIVCDKVYAVKIKAFDKIDWRKNEEKNQYIRIELPNEIQDMCFKMLNMFKLNFGAFDFIVNEKNEYIFLEVNPNGQWLWLETKLNLKISEDIVKYLSGFGDDNIDKHY